jgi:PEP-CTERM motif
MTSTFKVFRVAALAILLGFGTVTHAAAAPIVSIDPVLQTVQVGDALSVDLVVSGLTEVIGGFQALLSFDDSILSGVGYVIDPDDEFDGELDFSFGFSGVDDSPLDLFVVGTPGAGQPTSFRLATISFMATALGLSPLTLSGVILSDEGGDADIFPGVQSGAVCVAVQGETCRTVPEPGLLALIGTGIGTFVVRRRRGAKESRV